MNAKNAIDTILDELGKTLSHVSDDRAESLIRAVLDARTVFVAGAGRSGLAVKSFAMRLMHLGFHACVVGETVTPAITNRDLLLIGSGSGSTASLVSHAGRARAIGAPVVLITIQDDSPIARVADPVLTLPAPTPKMEGNPGFRSAQPLGSLFEQSLQLTLDALILLIMHQTGKGQDEMFGRHANLE